MSPTFVHATPFGFAGGLGARRARTATGLPGGGEEDDGEGEIHDGDGEEGVIERLSSDEPFPHHWDKKPYAAEREQARDEVFLPVLHASASFAERPGSAAPPRMAGSAAADGSAVMSLSHLRPGKKPVSSHVIGSFFSASASMVVFWK